MSEENVEIVRQVFDAVNRQDLEGTLEKLDPDFEMDWSRSRGPYRGVHRGEDQVRIMWRSLLEAWDKLSWEAEEIIEVDGARLIAVNHVRGRGLGSGVEVDATGAQLWTIQAGRAMRVVLFQSRDDALEAAGLKG